jgi:carboxypeptidase PM20D1
MTKKILGALLALFLLLAAVLAVNTLRKGSRQLPVEPLAPVAVDEAAAAQRLGAAVRLPTISSRDDAQLSADQFQALHALLAQQFPRVHAQLQREVVGGLSLLYTWKGTDPQAKPMALLAHQDVVPIAPGTEGDWAVPPFSGAVKDGHIWGRGAWDDKGNLLSQLEAVEMLLAQGYQPPRTLYLAYGADEEVGGQRGAAQIAALLQSRGVQLDFVLDEGLLVLDGVMPGLAKPAALIGVAEKGYMSVVLRLSATPGHSSMPPPKGTSAIAMLSAALKRLEDEQLPGGIRGVAAEMFDTLAPEMGGFSRVALSNLWLFGPLVQKQLEGAASTNALLRTTTALTIVQRGQQGERAARPRRGHGEFPHPARRHQGWRAAAHAQPGVAGGAARTASSCLPCLAPWRRPRWRPPIRPSTGRCNRPSARSSPTHWWHPGLMVGGHGLHPLRRHQRPHLQVLAHPRQREDLKRFHGTNERLSVKNYAEAIRFYHRLIPQVAKGAQ